MFLTVVVFLVKGVISIHEPETPLMAGDDNLDPNSTWFGQRTGNLSSNLLGLQHDVCVGLSVIGSLVCMLKVFCVEVGMRNEKCVCVSMRN